MFFYFFSNTLKQQLIINFTIFTESFQIAAPWLNSKYLQSVLAYSGTWLTPEHTDWIKCCHLLNFNYIKNNFNSRPFFQIFPQLFQRISQQMNCLSLFNVFFLHFFASWSIFVFFRSFVPITIFSYPDWALSSPSIFGLNDSLEEMFSGRNNLNLTLTKLNVSRKEDLTQKKIKDNFWFLLTRSKLFFCI